jgi:hypothetical protein
MTANLIRRFRIWRLERYIEEQREYQRQEETLALSCSRGLVLFHATNATQHMHAVDRAEKKLKELQS